MNTALDQASAWAKYTWYYGTLAGLGVGGGVRYVGETFGDTSTRWWFRLTRYSMPP